VLTLDGLLPSIAQQVSHARNSWSADTTTRRVGCSPSCNCQLRHRQGIGDDLCRRGRVQLLPGVDFWTGAIVLIASPGLHRLRGFTPSCTPRPCKPSFWLGGSIILTISDSLRSAAGTTLSIPCPGSPEHVPPLSNPDFPCWAPVCLSHCRHLVLGTDQHIVQRCLAARNEQQARGEPSSLPTSRCAFFVFLIPDLWGMRCRVRARSNSPIRSGIPNLVKICLPVGLRGCRGGIPGAS